MKKNDVFQIAIFTTYACLSIFLTVLLLIISIYAYSFLTTGNYPFYIEDVIYSAKAGLAGGIPLGIGSWVLTKIEEHKKHK